MLLLIEKGRKKKETKGRKDGTQRKEVLYYFEKGKEKRRKKTYITFKGKEDITLTVERVKEKRMWMKRGKVEDK